MINKEEINKFIPGFVMGFIRSIISHPFEIMKLRSQMNIQKNFYNNLSKGLHLSIISNSLERGIQFYYFQEKNKTQSIIISSIYASFISTSISLPYNIILLKKTVLMSNINIKNDILLKGGTLEYSRNLLGSTLFLYSYNSIKKTGQPIYVSSILSSIIVWLVTYPIDNIKNQIISKNNIKKDFKSLYKGIQYPILRSIPSSSIGLYVYENLNNYLNNG